MQCAVVVAVRAADEDFDAAFQSSSIPWYDAQTKEIKSIKKPKQTASSVLDRNRIRPKKIKKKGQQITKPKAITPPVGGGTAPAGSTFGTIGTSVIYLAAGVLIALLIALLVYGFLKLESGGKDLPSEAAKKKRKMKDHIKHLPFELEEHEGDFETFAEKAFREGDYSKSVVYLFADLLVAMNEAGVVRLQRGKTNRQYLNDIWGYKEIRPYYRSVMTAFEDAFFGQHEISKERAAACFAERPAFDAAIEKIRQQKFAAAQNEPSLSRPAVRIEGVT